MINIYQLLIDNCIDALTDSFRNVYGSDANEMETVIATEGRVLLAKIATTDALYHNLEHTIYVVSAGNAILQGMLKEEISIPAKIWLHFIVALLCHDIGVVKGICAEDEAFKREYVSGDNSDKVILPIGVSDASLLPYHLERGQVFVREYFSNHPLVDSKLVREYIERTRFPVPATAEYQQTSDYAGLVRAADLVGQLSDPRYLKKMNALFCEFEETGLTKLMNYKTPEDVLLGYPNFFENMVQPFIQEGVNFLQKTPAGEAFLVSLYGNLQTAITEIESKTT